MCLRERLNLPHPLGKFYPKNISAVLRELRLSRDGEKVRKMQRQHTHTHLIQNTCTQTSIYQASKGFQSKVHIWTGTTRDSRRETQRKIFDTRVNIRFGWAGMFFCPSQLVFFYWVSSQILVVCVTWTGMARMFGASFTVNSGKKLQDLDWSGTQSNTL